MNCKNILGIILTAKSTVTFYILWSCKINCKNNLNCKNIHLNVFLSALSILIADLKCFYHNLQRLLYQSSSGSPLPFHILNTLLHAANSCLVLYVTKSLAVGALFAVHPVHAEVGYITNFEFKLRPSEGVNK